MSVNGNIAIHTSQRRNATHISRYLTSQLTALWENSKELADHYGDAVELDETQELSLALAQFSVGRTEGMNSNEKHAFFASFGRPRLQIICSHDVVLHLKVEKGYFDLHSVKMDSIIPPGERHVDLHKEINVAFRLPFTTTGIRGRDHKFGSGERFVPTVVLDFSKARLVSADVTGTTLVALSVYLRQYFDLLVRAHHHILFSLPEVDDARYGLPIDFPSISTDIKWDIQEVHGVSIKKINNFLSSSWLKAAWLASSMGSLPSDRSKIYISEYSSAWSTHAESKLHFHLKFNAPQVRALQCDREVVLLFSVEEVLFSDIKDFSSATAKSRYVNWQIALIVAVIYDIQSDGNIILKIDPSSARFSQHLSNFHDIEETGNPDPAYVDRLSKFFSYEYLQILETAESHILYRLGTRVTVTFDDPETETETDSQWTWTLSDDEATDGDVWQKEITTKTDMFGFDQITAVSQESIEEHFRVLLLTYKDLEIWSRDTSFSATFGGITVRLFSTAHAVIWVDVKDGHFKTLQDGAPWNESKDYHILSWRLAFEVELKIANRQDVDGLSEGIRTPFEDSFARKFETSHQESVLKQIYLDIRNATFTPELSTFDDASYGRTRLGVDKVHAVIYYIQDYFHHLAAAGHHVIYSIPVWKVNTHGPRHALANVAFHVYSKQVVARGNWDRLSKFNQPILVILGMTDSHPPPPHALKYSTNWLIRTSDPYGTISLSRHLFFEGHLLPLLVNVNAATTVIPIRTDVEVGDWNLELTTWGSPGSRKKSLPTWGPATVGSNVLAYAWDYLDERTHKYDSNVRDGTEGTYSVSFHTCNQLSIPMEFKGGQLDINLDGETSVQIGYKGEHKQSSARASAKWSITISAIPTGSGLSFKVGDQISPTYEKSGESSSIRHKDLQTLLKDALPTSIKIPEVPSSPEASPEGVWSYCFPGLHAYALANPVFTTRGDILFELRPHGVWGSSTSTSTTTKAAGQPSPSPSPEAFIRPDDAKPSS